MAIRSVHCTLNAREYELRLDLGAMAALEEKGTTIEDVVQKLASGVFSPKSIRLALWAMLQSDDTPPTLKDIGRWVDGDNFKDVGLKVGEALRLAFPDQKEAPPDPLVGAGIGEPPSASPTAPSP